MQLPERSIILNSQTCSVCLIMSEPTYKIKCIPNIHLYVYLLRDVIKKVNLHTGNDIH